MEVNASSEHIFSSTQPEPDNVAQAGTSQSSDHPETELLDLISCPAKSAADSDDRVALEISGSTRDHDRNSARSVSEDEADQGVKEPDLGSESQTSSAISDQESVTGDCLTCSYYGGGISYVCTHEVP